jgi:hypothetical protein
MELGDVVGRTFMAVRDFRDQDVICLSTIMRTTKSLKGG